jgi:hypothetical protein
MDKRMYRYSSMRYNQQLLTQGVIRVGTLYDFRIMEHGKGIADPKEGTKNVSHHIDQIHIADPKDPNMKSNIDMRAMEAFQAIKLGDGAKNTTIVNVTFDRRLEAPDCFILCTSKICSQETMNQFENADSCVEIVDIESFYRILTDTLNSITPVLFRGIYEVVYQNREEKWNGQDWGRHPAMIKETKFNKQCELRAIWEPKVSKAIEPIICGDYRLGAFCRIVSI